MNKNFPQFNRFGHSAHSPLDLLTLLSPAGLNDVTISV